MQYTHAHSTSSFLLLFMACWLLSTHCVRYSTGLCVYHCTVIFILLVSLSTTARLSTCHLLVFLSTTVYVSLPVVILSLCKDYMCFYLTPGCLCFYYCVSLYLSQWLCVGNYVSAYLSLPVPVSTTMYLFIPFTCLSLCILLCVSESVRLILFGLTTLCFSTYHLTVSVSIAVCLCTRHLLVNVSIIACFFNSFLPFFCFYLPLYSLLITCMSQCLPLYLYS